MPELPEVETIKRQLAARVEGRKIDQVKVHDPKLCEPFSPRVFEESLRDMRVVSLTRRGKYLIAELAGDDLNSQSFLLMHLRMSGNLLYSNGTQKLEQKYVRGTFMFDDGASIQFVDPRRFGRILIIEGEDALSGYFEKRLGIEPFEQSFTPELLFEKARCRRRPVKPFLLDQANLAGVGNIYADEALFRAGIHPAQPVGTLNRAELVSLHAGILDALKAGISAGGASVERFRHFDGGTGSMQDEFLVHNREGQTCPSCKAKIVKIQLAGRGTYLCRSCQRLRRRTLKTGRKDKHH